MPHPSQSNIREMEKYIGQLHASMEEEFASITITSEDILLFDKYHSLLKYEEEY